MKYSINVYLCTTGFLWSLCCETHRWGARSFVWGRAMRTRSADVATAKYILSSQPLTTLDEETIGDEEIGKAEENEEVSQLKSDLFALASSSKRGFSATNVQKDEARRLCEKLKLLNPTKEPLYPYYSNEDKSGDDVGVSLAGKWTLVYTDAPDITSLDGGPLAIAKLGRIGQECNPPLVKNVIEWLKPDWSDRLPFSVGNDDGRVLQKVCTEASASPTDPFRANLKAVGLDIVGYISDDPAPTKSLPLPDNPAQIFKKNPVELRGPLKAPFGQFEVLYLDSEMRIIKTYQGFIAVNVRLQPSEEWF